MINYEQIKKANEQIQSLTIERANKDGSIAKKEYAEVNQRIKAFRMVYPNGSITTDIVSLTDGVVLMQTKVSNEEGVIIGTGYATEKEGSSFINRTSFIENCETSAVGRALGMCGFGIDTSVASYEEVANAQANQNTQPTITDQQKEIILKNNNPDVFKKHGIKTKKDLDKLTVIQASNLIKELQHDTSNK